MTPKTTITGKEISGTSIGGFPLVTARAAPLPQLVTSSRKAVAHSSTLNNMVVRVYMTNTYVRIPKLSWRYLLYSSLPGWSLIIAVSANAGQIHCTLTPVSLYTALLLIYRIGVSTQNNNISKTKTKNMSKLKTNTKSMIETKTCTKNQINSLTKIDTETKIKTLNMTKIKIQTMTKTKTQTKET